MAHRMAPSRMAATPAVNAGLVRFESMARIRVPDESMAARSESSARRLSANGFSLMTWQPWDAARAAIYSSTSMSSSSSQQGQPTKTRCPMSVTLAGIATDVRAQ